MTHEAMTSSKNPNWATPLYVFDPLHAEFRFDVDLCATADNTKCPIFIDPDTDSLSVPWHTYGRVGWCNPPYDKKGTSRKFVAKAVEERQHGFTTVLLLAARTDTRLFHDYLWDGQAHHPRTGVSLRFFSGRIVFEGATAGALFPSMLAIVHAST